MRNRPLAAILALLAGFFPIAAQQHAGPVHQRAAAPTAPVRLTDAQIDAAIRLKLAKSKIGPDKFRFKVQGGVVTIEGKTDIIQHKGAATRMAHTAGAIGVNNHIEISDAAKQKASDNLAKGRRRAQIVRGEPRTTSATLRPAADPTRKTAPHPTVQKQ
jgi:BON domain